MYCMLLFNLMLVLPLFSCSCLALTSMLAKLIKPYWWRFKATVTTGVVVDYNEEIWFQWYIRTEKKMWYYPCDEEYCWLSSDIHSRKKYSSGFFRKPHSHPLIHLEHKNSQKFLQHFFQLQLHWKCKPIQYFFHLISSVPYVWLRLTKVFNFSLYWEKKNECCWDSCLLQQLFFDLHEGIFK